MLLSTIDEQRGFDVVLNEHGHVLLQYTVGILAGFDPTDYTLPQFRRAIEAQLQKFRDRTRLVIYQFNLPSGTDSRAMVSNKTLV